MTPSCIPVSKLHLQQLCSQVLKRPLQCHCSAPVPFCPGKAAPNLPALDRIIGASPHQLTTARGPHTAQPWQRWLVPWPPVIKPAVMTIAQNEYSASILVTAEFIPQQKAAVKVYELEPKQLAWLPTSVSRSFRHLTLESSSSSGDDSTSTSLGIAL